MQSWGTHWQGPEIIGQTSQSCSCFRTVYMHEPPGCEMLTSLSFLDRRRSLQTVSVLRSYLDLGNPKGVLPLKTLCEVWSELAIRDCRVILITRKSSARAKNVGGSAGGRGRRRRSRGSLMPEGVEHLLCGWGSFVTCDGEAALDKALRLR